MRTLALRLRRPITILQTIVVLALFVQLNILIVLVFPTIMEVSHKNGDRLEQQDLLWWTTQQPPAWKRGSTAFDETRYSRSSLSDTDGMILDDLHSRSLADAELPIRSYPLHSLPCTLLEEDWKLKLQATRETKEGFFFMKPNKVGSSTAIGVHLRLARNAARRQPAVLSSSSSSSANSNTTMCKSRWGHAQLRRKHHRLLSSPASLLFQNRSESHSFLWTLLRHPTRRAISSFFHLQVSRDGVVPSDDNFRRHMERKPPRDYYINTLPVVAPLAADDLPLDATIIPSILGDYDFIAITERMDESLVVLSFLLQVPWTDLLYLSAKQGGTSYDNMNPCQRLQTSFVSPAMGQYFEGTEWQDVIRNDLVLYRAANQSLDRTIDHVVGRDRFEQRLSHFRALQHNAQELCLPTAVFPCDSHGVYHTETDCLWMDSGCGATCLDQVASVALDGEEDASPVVRKEQIRNE